MQLKTCKSDLVRFIHAVPCFPDRHLVGFPLEMMNTPGRTQGEGEGPAWNIIEVYEVSRYSKKDILVDVIARLSFLKLVHRVHMHS